jgi:hypothetical protein
MLGAKEPGHQGDQAEQRNGNEKLALHGRAPGLLSDTKGDKTFIR